MYMCSNTGLFGWAELRNRTRLCFQPTHKLLIKSAKSVVDCPTRFFLRSRPRLSPSICQFLQTRPTVQYSIQPP
ncbi:uncharacterized protein N7500_002872 [Penicillium coprophilum]|uniref:uncharacterized protein n=1 Tax=Penicillium coprophilum TaxID=36646 RepID=UPI00238CEC91|nr:uncharacterized protein N7500_002872 [Penicillium coprophilum]KAJ5170089.1 hypothetical protein N7500_002872 [Penicillium coprophilum]